MAQIYKEDGFLIIEGYGAIPIKRADIEVNGSVVSIWDRSKNKVAFNGDWTKVQDQNGDSLIDQSSAITYLNESLTETPLNIDGGIIF